MTKFIKWLMFTLGFALLPIFITLGITNLMKGQTNITYNFIPELLFLSLMVCSTTLDDLICIKKKLVKEELFTLFICVLIILSITSSVVYGCSIVDNYSAESIFDISKLKAFSICISAASSILCSIIKIFIIRIEGE